MSFLQGLTMTTSHRWATSTANTTSIYMAEDADNSIPWDWDRVETGDLTGVNAGSDISITSFTSSEAVQTALFVAPINCKLHTISWAVTINSMTTDHTGIIISVAKLPITSGATQTDVCTATVVGHTLIEPPDPLPTGGVVASGTERLSGENRDIAAGDALGIFLQAEGASIGAVWGVITLTYEIG